MFLGRFVLTRPGCRSFLFTSLANASHWRNCNLGKGNERECDIVGGFRARIRNDVLSSVSNNLIDFQKNSAILEYFY